MSFEQEVWLRFFNASFTGAFVGVAAGLITWLVQRRAEGKAQDRERQRDLDRERRELRRELLKRASEVNGAFYFKTQQYWRQKREPATWGAPDSAAIDTAYIQWAMAAEAMERDIAALFGWGSDPERLLHGVRDLLTVRYYNLREKDTDTLRRKNAKTDESEHSGLTEEQLKSMKNVLAAFHSRSSQLSRELLTARFEAEPT